ncbi:accessory Sec system glycosyltransferase Asp1 [Lactobacillus sp. ESL0791]|uniref:accessory Sec system glycosyltransferase Asp1 n=1 Tax=Lactobacillus sp. ESL0791 TaxID=2983234 RepID=UPI0023F88756|nr:accessory Sec system glycosyltransferase Asp1 [Lactobacillus sp. ESL0791]MDF7638654.1 accessory Sec system glycosyltransferase Asp1 [Lactobacillus sp. ESL0791]
MYYFLNEQLAANCSGIEHAELKRMRLFHKYGVPAKLVMSGYNRFGHQSLKLYGVAEEDYINMFDYYADAQNYHEPPMSVNDLPIPETAKAVQVENGYDVYADQRKIMTVNLLPDQEDQIDTIQYFNIDDHLLKQECYDTRGFLSMTQFYDTANGNLTYEQFYRPDGSIYCEISSEHRDNDVVTNVELTDLDGYQYTFRDLGEAFTLMLDQLNQQDLANGEKSTFISDRSNITNVPMLNMKTPARKIEHFHNIHFRDYWDPSSPLTYASIANEEQLAQTDLVITPTKKQAKDMAARLETDVPIVGIPVGVVPDKQLHVKHVPLKERKRGKIIAVARLYYEKRLDDAIKAFAKAREQLPYLTFDIYGYANDVDGCQEEKMLKQLVEQLHLQDAVTFKGYTQGMDSVYNSAQLLMMSSRYEGAPLSLVEAQSYGVPVISYDINYGPSDIIQDKKSGFLIPSGKIDLLAQKTVDFFKDPQLQESMSKASYENAKRFSEDNVWQEWQKYVIAPAKD